MQSSEYFQIFMIHFLFILLLYITSQPKFTLPPFLQVFTTTSSPLSQITPPLFLFRKGHVSQGYQPNTAYQTRRITSPHIKVGWGNPVGGKASQKQQDSETVPVPSVSSTTETLAVTYVQRT